MEILLFLILFVLIVKDMGHGSTTQLMFINDKLSILTSRIDNIQSELRKLREEK